MEGSALEEKPSFKILGGLFLLRLLCISISLQSYHTSIYGILLSHLEWFPWLLLGIVGQATKMDIQDCWSFTCCFSWTLGSSWKCGQLKSFLDVFVRCSSGLNQLVPLPFSKGDQHVVLIDCMIFLSPFLEVTRMSISSFFPCTARLWNSLPIKCFPLAYNVNGFKSRIKSINCRFFLKRLPVCVNLFVFLFLAIPYRIVAVQPCMEWIPIKKKI